MSKSLALKLINVILNEVKSIEFDKELDKVQSLVKQIADRDYVSKHKE